MLGPYLFLKILPLAFNPASLPQIKRSTNARIHIHDVTSIYPDLIWLPVACMARDVGFRVVQLILNYGLNRVL